MIKGIGTDILQIERAAAALSRTPGLAQRVLTPQELTGYQSASDAVRFFAKRFAAKEAIVKAIGSGIGRGVSWQHIQINKDSFGKPLVELSGGGYNYASQQNIAVVHLSYTDERDYVVAFAIAESS